MKKIVSAVLVTMLAIPLVASSVSAANHSGKLVKKVAISLSDNKSNVNSTVAELSVYDDNGIKLYTVTGAQTPNEKRKAFEILNSFMEKGAVEQQTVNVTSTGTDFYGSEYGYSSANNNAMGYTWAKYNASASFPTTGTDKTWGGQSAAWNGSGTAAYIKLYQSVTLNVSNASTTLTVGWPPSMSVTPTKSSSTASWYSDSITNVNILGAEHGTVQFNKQDIQGGYVTSCVYNDSADVKVGSTIYRPTNSVRFTNGL
ncbi:hypothetical protein ABEW34_24960 [Paenibacillus algorifonticola]|uniref:hypothetical protein n=1 Tax=Paenibacillus algorifonticola TaxID=684063 RepID=UPI003D2B4398